MIQYKNGSFTLRGKSVSLNKATIEEFRSIPWSDDDQLLEVISEEFDARYGINLTPIDGAYIFHVIKCLTRSFDEPMDSFQFLWVWWNIAPS